jgi:hypothetical protein
MDDELDPTLGDAIKRLRDTHPDQDLWPRIARQLEPRHPRGTVLMRWPTALAAGLALVAVSAAGTSVLMHRQTRADTAITGIMASTLPSTMNPSDAALARAVSDLEKAVKGTLEQLDPEARATVTKTLAMLDDAIAQAAARQTAAPDDPRAARFLTSTLKKKLQLLRTVSGLTQKQS